MKFTKHKEPEIKPTPKKRSKTVKLFKFSVVFFFLAWAVFGIVTFYNTHTFRSPVLFQNPVPLKVNTIISPTASPSAGFIRQVEASEIVNPFNPKSPKGIVFDTVKKTFGIQEWGALEEIVFNESGWNPYSINRSSGACGLFQALPCSKMKCEYYDFQCQADWGVNYIKDRYGVPSKALAFWSEKGWY
jgi:hypothetical protein